MAIKINIGTLNEGSQILELKSDAKELGLDENLLNDDVTVKLELFKTSHQLDIKTSVNCIINLECDRCLENFRMPLKTGFELVFVQQNPREEEIDEDYIRSYSPHMRTVDITTDIKESILLSQPMKKIPAEKPDGSCSWCGKTKEYWSSFIVENDNEDK